MNREKLLLNALLGNLNQFFLRGEEGKVALEDVLKPKLASNDFFQLDYQIEQIIRQAREIATDLEQRDKRADGIAKLLTPLFQNISLPQTSESSRRSGCWDRYKHRLISLGGSNNDVNRGEELKQIIFPLPESQSVSHSPEDYHKLWEEQFLPELKRLPEGNFNYLFHSLYFLLQKYAWAIPCTANSDIPLFDYLRTVAAVADCLFVSQDNQPFLFCYGDLSGIQDFIYKIRSPEQASRYTSVRLRGRSFYLSLLRETFVHYLRERLNLSIVSLIWCEGGNFLILAPNTEENRRHIEDAHRVIQQFLLREFRGDLYLNLVWQEADAAGIKDFSKVFEGTNQDNIPENTIEADGIAMKVAQSKLQRYFDVEEFRLQKSECIFNLGIDICDVCQADIMEDELKMAPDEEGVKLCPNCLKHKRVGHWLVNLRRLYRIHATPIPRGINKSPSAIAFEDFGIYWKLNSIGKVNNNSKVYQYAINCTDFLPQRPKLYKIQRGYGFWFLANAVAFKRAAKLKPAKSTLRKNRSQMELKSENFPHLSPLTFDELAAKTAANRLGVLRMDVDDLGAVLSFGLQSQPLAWRSALSRMIEMFFSWYINELCQGRMVYVTYSGGDDLFIVGSWDEIVQLAGEISRDFHEYTCQNRYLHVSGGIFLARPKFPISRSAYYAGVNLERAKDYINKENERKDALNLFDMNIEWEHFYPSKEREAAVQLIADEIARRIQNGQLGHGFIYKLLRIYNECRMGESVQITQWFAKFRYLISRDFAGDITYQMKLLQPETIELIRQYTPILASYVHYATKTE